MAAHGVGLRFDLPLPAAHYTAGVAGVVAVSFLLAVLLPARRGSWTPPREIDLLRWAPARWLTGEPVLAAARALSVAVLALVIVAGVVGNPDPYQNIAPTLVWVVFWVGFAYVCAFAGNAWLVFNPWSGLGQCAASAAAVWRGAATRRRTMRLRPGLGVWPAAALLLGFAWLETSGSIASRPSAIGWLVGTYTLLTCLGMLLFGRACWLSRAEVFTVAFGLLSRFAVTDLRLAGEPRGGPVEAPVERQAARHGHQVRSWRLRAPGAGLLAEPPTAPGTVAFVLLMLSSVTFDGFRDTVAWKTLVAGAVSTPALVPVWRWSWSTLGIYDVAALTTLGLLAFAGGFLGLFTLACRAGAALSGGSRDTRTFMRASCLSLVPIAIGYHVGHYLPLLLHAGQLVIPMASDPFGVGWNLFGTAHAQIDFGLVHPLVIWNVSVAAVSLGHVASVLIGHRLALRVFEDPRAAARSQYALVALMVGYSTLSLWILTQPLAH